MDKERYNKYHRDYVKRNKDRIYSERSRKKYYLKYNGTLEGVYRNYKNNARFKKRDFAISIVDFEKLFWNKECIYCGNKITTAGIDRIDSSVGYTINNCVPCCYRCNVAKNNMNIEEFKKMISDIYNNFILEIK